VDLGFLFRWNGTAVERVSALQDSPNHLVARDGYLYWRARASAATNFWVVRRLRLPAAACAPECAVPEEVGGRAGDEIKGVFPLRADLVYFQFGPGELFRATPSVVGAPWNVANATVTSDRPAALARGARAVWGQGSSAWTLTATGPETIFIGAGGLPQAKLIHTACDKTYFYDDARTLAPLSSLGSTGFSEVSCNGAACGTQLTFAMDTDERFVYVARPNLRGVQVIHRAGGVDPKVIVPGVDAWDVAVDDRYVYYTDVAGAAVGRVDKLAR
jgi:hypothetical protein